MTLLRILPTVILSWLLYHLVFLAQHDAFGADAAAVLNRTALTVFLLNGGRWVISIGDAITILTVLAGFAEVAKSSSLRRAQLIDHGFVMLFFTLTIVEFLNFKPAQTSVFFFIVLAAFLDVIVGYVVGIRVARRDIAVERGAP